MNSMNSIEVPRLNGHSNSHYFKNGSPEENGNGNGNSYKHSSSPSSASPFKNGFHTLNDGQTEEL